MRIYRLGFPVLYHGPAMTALCEEIVNSRIGIILDQVDSGTAENVLSDVIRSFPIHNERYLARTNPNWETLDGLFQRTGSGRRQNIPSAPKEKK